MDQFGKPSPEFSWKNLGSFHRRHFLQNGKQLNKLQHLLATWNREKILATFFQRFGINPL